MWSYQERVAELHTQLFAGDPTDVAERRARFFEEANETCQALGMSRGEAHQLVDYTYGRAFGDATKEVGSAMLTLASLCVVAGIDLMQSAEQDLAKLGLPESIERVRAKRATRHGRGPLPGLDPGGIIPHPDDLAVDRFAFAMKAKLAAKRAMGYGGWDGPEEAISRRLACALVDHVAKGDPVDIANYAMMLHQRGADRSVIRDAAAIGRRQLTMSIAATWRDAVCDRFAELMAAQGIVLPIRTDPDQVGVIFDAGNRDVATVDSNGRRDDDDARKIAELLAFAINALSGTWPEPTPDPVPPPAPDPDPADPSEGGETPRLKDLLARAKARQAAMTPEERAAENEAQRESFVRAMTTPCEHGVLDWETCPQCRAASGGLQTPEGRENA